MAPVTTGTKAHGCAAVVMPRTPTSRDYLGDQVGGGEHDAQSARFLPNPHFRFFNLILVPQIQFGSVW